jgi:hypothetical protein
MQFHIAHFSAFSRRIFHPRPQEGVFRCDFNKIIKVNIPFEVNFNFEAGGEPEIRAACFYFSGDGPNCFKVTGVNYGSPGTIQAQIRTKNPGSRRLEGYVLYIRDGKIQSTNVISIYFPVIPQ